MDGRRQASIWTTLTLLSLAGCANHQPVATSASPQAPQPAPEAPMDAVTRSAAREHALSILEEMALSTSPLLRANALEGLHPTPSRAEAAARVGLADDNVGVRYAAAMTVGKLRLNALCDKVRPLISDSSPIVRSAAIYALTRNAQKVDQSPISQLLASPNPRNRAQAAYILGEMGNASAVPMLREAARNGTGDSASVRLFKLQVAEALVKLGDDVSANVLEAALYPKLPEEFEGAVLAAQVIGEVRSERAIWQLVNLVEAQIPNASESAAPTTPEAVADAKTRARADSKTNTGKTGPKYLYPKELRLAAATALAKMGQFGGTYVADEYRDDPEPVIRAQAAFLYGATGQAQFLRPLEKMTDDPSPIVRVAAASATIRLMDQPR